MADRGTLYSDYLAKENTTAVSGVFVILVFLRHFYGNTTVNGAFDGFAGQLNTQMGQLLVTAFLSILSVLIAAALVFSLRFASCRRTVTVAATGEKNAQSENTQLYLKDISYDSKTAKVPMPAQGNRVRYQNMYCWFSREDRRAQADMTDSIVLRLPLRQNTSLRFVGNRWKGTVRVSEGDWETIADTFLPKEDGEPVAVPLPEPTLLQVVGTVFAPGALMTVLLFAGYALLELPRLIRKRKTRG